MTNDIVELGRTRAPTIFQPQEARREILKIEAVLNYAKKLGDWPMTKEAAENLIFYQKQILVWWHENVTPTPIRRSFLSMKPKRSWATGSNRFRSGEGA